MNDSERRRYEMLVRVKQFGIENSADFPPASVGAFKFALVGARDDPGKDRKSESLRRKMRPSAK